MRILHTSDWHIGNRLMDHSREGEFRAFFQWLAGVLEERKVDALLVSGDVFDTSTPGDPARAVYCDFLSRAHAAGCRQIIITAGNHDGMANLGVEAPILSWLGIHVVARLRTEDAASCLVPLTDAGGEEAALVCAVPYMRPQDVALAAPVDDAQRRMSAYTDGIAACYARVAEAAQVWKDAHPGLPVIAMGHLAVGGAEATASTRRLIGTLDTVPADVFPEVFDYVALGHIHRPQAMQGGRIRYCGSPLPMGVDEVQQPGRLVLIDTQSGVEELEIPCFARYGTATCANMEEVDALLRELGGLSAAQGGIPVRLQLSYTGTDCTLRSLYEYIGKHAAAHGIDHYLISHDTPAATARAAARVADSLPTLGELGEGDLFRQRLDEWSAASPLPPDRRARLESLFSQALAEARATLQNTTQA